MGCRPGTYLKLNRFGRRACRLGIALFLVGVLLPAGALYGQQEAEMPAAEDAPPAMGERVLELTLEDAIQLALQNSLAIERERFGPLIALTDTDRAKVEFDPKVGAEVNVSQTQNLQMNQQFAPVLEDRSTLSAYLRHRIVTGGNYEVRVLTSRSKQSSDDFGFFAPLLQSPGSKTALELTFTHPLLQNFGIAVNKAPIHQGEIREQIAEQGVIQAILDTVFAVHQRLLATGVSHPGPGCQASNRRKLAEDFLAENTVRVELGTLAPIELVQAETRVKTREGDVIVAESELREADDQTQGHPEHTREHGFLECAPATDG